MAKNPKTAQDFFDLGKNNYQSQNFQEAIGYFTKAISLNPDDDIAYFNRGVSYNNLEKYSEAIADFTQAISLKPYFYEAYVNRGKIYQKLGKNESANLDFTQAIKLNPVLKDIIDDLIKSQEKLEESEKKIENITKYDDYAQKEENNANKFRNYALVALVFLILMFFILILCQFYGYNDYNDIYENNYFLAKIIIFNSLIIFLISYLMRQAGKHRESQIIYRQRALILGSIDNYAKKNINSSENQDKLYLDIANTVFSDRLAINADNKTNKSDLVSPKDMLDFMAKILPKQNSDPK